MPYPGFLVGIPSMILGAMAGAVLAGALIIAGALLILADQVALTARRDP